MAAELLQPVRLLNVILAATAYLTVRRRGDARRFFQLYLIFHATRGAILLWLPPNRTWYGHLYFATEPVAWVLYVLIVVEVYTLALRSFTGILALTKWVLVAVVAAALVVSLLSLVPDVNSPHPFPIVQLATAAGRALCTSLALFLLGAALFFIAYPIPLSRNTIIHSAVCSVYFLTLAAAYFVHNVVGPESWPVVNLTLVAITAATFLAWILLLKPEGEHVIVRHRPQWSPEAEEQMLARLDALNGVLLRSIRK